MVLQVRVDAASDDGSYRRSFKCYTVDVEDHRIFTVVTFSEEVLSRWVKESMEKMKNGANVVVAVSAERRGSSGRRPYQLLTLCMASNRCLMVQLDKAEPVPEPLCKFFADPRVIAVGFDMASMAVRLKQLHGLTIRRGVDVRTMADELNIKKERKNVDNGRIVDILAKKVLGLQFLRPRETLDWFCSGGDNDSHYNFWWQRPLALPKVQWATYDAYIVYAIACMHNPATVQQYSLKSSKKKKS